MTAVCLVLKANFSNPGFEGRFKYFCLLGELFCIIYYSIFLRSFCGNRAECIWLFTIGTEVFKLLNDLYLPCETFKDFPSLGREAHHGSPGSASQSTAGVETTAQGTGGCAWQCTNKHCDKRCLYSKCTYAHWVEYVLSGSTETKITLKLHRKE